MSDQKQFIPKYQYVLDRLKKQVEKGRPGDRLPTVRGMMAEHQVSQAGIERCLDVLVRMGRVRRERGRGIFIDGVQPRSNVIGVYTDGEQNPLSSALFLDGVRKGAESEGFQVADFGPLYASQGQEKTFQTMVDMGFAGILIAALSSANFFDFESNKHLATLLQNHRLPVVTSRPFPAVEADSVMPDYFAAFKRLGEHLRERIDSPVLFLGHQGIPTLARLSGLRAGLGSQVEIETEMLDGFKNGGAYGRVAELIEQNWKGTLVLGVPPRDAGVVTCLEGAPWADHEGCETAIILETNQGLAPDVSAHVLVKPSFRLGEAAAKQVIKRIRGYQVEMTHITVSHEVHLLENLVTTKG